MPDYSAIALGTLEFDTRVDLAGYNRDRARLINDTNQLAATLGSNVSYGLASSMRGLSGEIERNLIEGVTNALRRIEQLTAQSAQRQQKLAAPQVQVLGASFQNATLSRDSQKAGQVAGKAMGTGVAEGFQSSEAFIAAAANKSISKAILATDFIKFGLKKAVEGALGTLPGQVSQVIAGTLSGGSNLGQGIQLQLETNTAVSTLAALTNLDIGGAADQIDALNKRLAASAAALPGETQEYKNLANVLSDNLIGAFKGIDGTLDTSGYIDSLSSLSESFGAITASTTKDTGNTALALTRALGGATESQLRQFAFFEQAPTALSAISSKLAQTGVESLADLTIEGRVKLLEAVGNTLITDDFKKLAENSVDGLLQSFRSSLFDPTTGILGLNRDLDSGLKGTQSVFTSFNEVLRGLIGQSSDDMGLLFRIADSAKKAGLNIGDPLANQKRILDAIAQSIEYAKTKTDDFFQAPAGQLIISVMNSVQSAIQAVLGDADALKLAFTVAGTVVAGPFGGAFAFAVANAERVLPVLQEVGGGVVSLFQAAVPYVQQLADLLLTIAERAAPLASGFLGGISSGIGAIASGGLGGLVGGVSSGIGAIASGGIGGLGDTLSSGLSSGLSGISSLGGTLGSGLGGGGASFGEDTSGGGGMAAFGAEKIAQIQAAFEGLGPILSNIGEIFSSIGSTLGSIVNLAIGLAPSFAPFTEAVTSLVSGVFAGLAETFDRVFGGIRENSAGIAEGFAGIATIAQALEPAFAALGGLVGEIAIQAINLLANLASNETLIKALTNDAELLRKTFEGITNFLDNNEWALKFVAVGAAIAGVMKLNTALNLGWAALSLNLAPVITTITGILSGIGSAIIAVIGFLNPLTLTIIGVVAAVAGIGFAIYKLWPQITALWDGFKKSAGDAINSAKGKVGELWTKTEGLRDRFGDVGTKIKDGVGYLGQMTIKATNMAGPLEKLKSIAGGIKDKFLEALSTLGDIGKKVASLFRSFGNGGGGDGTGAGELFVGKMGTTGHSTGNHTHFQTNDGSELSLDEINRRYRFDGKPATASAVTNDEHDHANRGSRGFDVAIGAGVAVSAIDAVSIGPTTWSDSLGWYNEVTFADGFVIRQGHFLKPDAALAGARTATPAQSNSMTSAHPMNGGGSGGGGGSLGSGYGALEGLQRRLAGNQYFNPGTPNGASALALASLIAGSETLGQGSSRSDYFTMKGGSNDAMRGAFQFNTEFFERQTRTEQDQVNLLGRMLTGQSALPNGGSTKDLAQMLTDAIQRGTVSNGNQLVTWARNQGLGGSNWQGIDDGIGRIPGLANQLVRSLQGATQMVQGGSLPDRRSNNAEERARMAESNGSSSPSSSSSSTATADSGDLTQYINPSQAAKRALEEARVQLKKEAELRQQARAEEDRTIKREREQRQAELKEELSALDPRDTAGRLLLEYEEQVLAVDESMGDRVRENNRQLEDLESARSLKIRQMTELESNRKAYTEALARGIDTGGVTEETLKKQADEISAIDYSAAITELEGYRDGLQALVEPQLATARNNLIHQLDAEVEKTDDLVNATTSLVQQYTDVSPYEKFQTQQMKIGIAFADQAESIQYAISTLDQLATIEGLSEEQTAGLTTQRERAAQALDGLTAAQDRATASLALNYQRQQEDQQITDFKRIAGSRSRVIEAQANSVERFEPQVAIDLRRQNAQFQLVLETGIEARNIAREQADAIANLNDAIAQGNTEYIAMQAELGRGTVEGIQSTYAQINAENAEVARLQYAALAEQFPTVAQAFKTSVRDSFSGGFKEGLLSIANGGGFFEAIGNIFNKISSSILDKGAQVATDYVTKQLFGNGDRGGWLDGLFGGNEDSLPAQGQSAADALEAGGQQAGQLLETGGQAAGDRIIAAATQASNQLASMSLNPLNTPNSDLPLFPGTTRPADTSSIVPFVRSPLSILRGPKDSPDDKEPIFRNAGITLGRTFAEQMPKAGEALSTRFGQRLPNLLDSALSIFGGKGGSSGGGGVGGILNLVGGIIGLFSNGGFVANYAYGGIGEAMSRERSQSGRKPRLAVVNENEFILSADATDRLMARYGPSFLESLNQGIVPNYAQGGFAGALQPVSQREAVRGDRTSGGLGQQRYVFEYQQAGNQRFVDAVQLEGLQQQINEKASASESVQATFELIKNYPEVRQDLGFSR